MRQGDVLKTRRKNQPVCSLSRINRPTPKIKLSMTGKRYAMTESNQKPLITFALFAYNQERFIREAVEGAFSQTYSPLEIILSDDCSSDRTFEIMEEMTAQYNGPHTVVLNRNKNNLGLIGHINRMMELVKSDLIVVAAGDDVSLPKRAERIYKEYNSSKALSIYSTCMKIDEKGIAIENNGFNNGSRFKWGSPDNCFSLGFMAEHQVAVSGASHAWHRELFDQFGPLDKRVVQEDAAIPFRAALIGKIKFIEEVLVKKREHTENTWNNPKAISFDDNVKWHRTRFDKLVDNIIGLWELKLADMDKLKYLYPKRYKEIQNIRPLLIKRLVDSYLEKTYLYSNGIHRLTLIFRAIKNRSNPARIVRWVLQYSFTNIYYRLYKFF